MPRKSQTLALAATLRQGFENQAAIAVETPVLQPADMLLGLYGEDIRARAYVTSDALRGEQMLRPDFTVPVVQMHMAEGAEPARYTYAGEVFRRQEQTPDRPNEYLQVGYEIFDRENPAAADAEVFVRIRAALGDLPLRAATGDIGVLIAAVGGLKTTEARLAALMRHLWRPRRFRHLLERYSDRGETPDQRLARLKDNLASAKGVPEIGKRRWAEIAERMQTLAVEADTPPISAGEIEAIETLLSVRETLPFALAQLRDVAVDLPSISPALDQMERRIAALSDAGADVDTLEFEASYGRTSMEYYDGFVFGFYAETRPDLPPVATGGRYDALTRRLGQGREIPAVGAVLRPDVMLELQEA